MARLAFFFRTHFWDDFAERMAGHAASQFGDADFFIGADHSRGAFACGRYEVVGHRLDEFAKIGLPSRPPERTMWYNADYAFVDAMLKKPNYDYYVFCEYDVRFNIDFAVLRARIEATDFDLFGPNFARVDATWRHFESTAPYYAEVFRFLPVFAVFSKRLLDRLFAKRVELGATLGPDQPWPYCESFMGSEAVAGGFRVDPMLDVFLTRHCRFGPAIAEAAVTSLLPNEIRHPVLSPERFPTWFRQPLKRAHGVLKNKAPFSLFG